MTKAKSKHGLAQKVKKLPQAGIIYAIRSQDIVTYRSSSKKFVPVNKPRAMAAHFNSNNNKAVTTLSVESLASTDKAVSNSELDSQDSHSTVSLSSENILEHLFVTHSNTKKHSMTVNRGSIESGSKTTTENRSLHLVGGKVDDRVRKPSSDKELEHLITQTKQRHQNQRKRLSKQVPISKSKLLGDNEKANHKFKEQTFVKTDKQIGSPVLDSKTMTRHVPRIEKCSGDSEQSSDCIMQRDNSDLLTRYQDVSMELSKIKVKYNEMLLENCTLKQMNDNLTLDINNLRYENSSVKTRNETLAATNLENQNLSRIVECLNKKIKELYKQIDQSQTYDSDRNRRLIELEKTSAEAQESSALLLVEIEHLKDQLIQKDVEIKRICHSLKNDEVKDLQMKLIHNELVELKGNIRVICRTKPESNNLIQIVDNETLQMPSMKQQSKHSCLVYNFNRVFRPNCSQTDIFNEVKPLVTSFVDGYNVSMITYGQSGSGKTFTMIGDRDNPGIVTNSIREAFRLTAQRSSWTFRICLSVLEIYNEVIFDLLATSGQKSGSGGCWRKRSQIHDDGRCIHIKGLSEIEIHHEEELLQYINLSSRNRATAITSQNADSSRSHLIVMLRIYGKNPYQNCCSQGVLMLCDLAGSENCSQTLLDNCLLESKYISKSLTVIGRVFEALYNRLAVIPFRDSKLTHILKPSLSGEAKFAFIVTISGRIENLSNTCRVLNLAKKVAQISLGPARKNSSHRVSSLATRPLARAELLCRSG